MTAVLAPALTRRRPPFSLSRWVEREGVFSWLMVALPVAFLVALVGYPFFYGIWISLQDRPVAKPGEFVGLDNFIHAWHDPVFRQVGGQHHLLYRRRDAPEDGGRASASPW